MGNQLFIQARNFVQQAKDATGSGQYEAISKAQNALSSAFAHSTMAEQKQLSELQTELDQLT